VSKYDRSFSKQSRYFGHTEKSWYEDGTRDGSGKMDDIMQHKTYKKRTPPREKYAAVESGVWTKVVPIMMACKIKVLCTK
jgi:hypothetical protein